MQILFWVLLLNLSKENTDVKNFDDMIAEMKSNPLAFNVAIFFVTFFGSKKSSTEISEAIFKAPISNNIDRKILETYIDSLGIKSSFFTDNEIEMLGFLTYFKRDGSPMWFLIFRTRIIYSVFCQFKTIKNLKFEKLDKKCEFIQYLVSYASKYYPKESDTHNECIENIQNYEKEIVLKDLKDFKNIIQSFNNDLVSIENLNVTEDRTTFDAYEQFLTTDSELNTKKITQSTVGSDKKQQIFYFTDPIYLNYVKLEDDILLHAKNCYVTYDLHLFLKELFEYSFKINSKSSSEDEIYQEYFGEEIFKICCQILKNNDDEKKEMIFEYFYKISLKYFEKCLENIFTYVKSQSFLEFQNIDAFLEKFLPHFSEGNNTSCGLSFVSLLSEPIGRSWKDEKVLVFDIDDTLFPTQHIMNDFGIYYSIFRHPTSQALRPYMIEKLQRIYLKSKKESEEIVNGILRFNDSTNLSTIFSHLKFKEEFRERLQKLPYKKICFTNAARKSAQYILKEMDLLDCFDCVIHKDYGPRRFLFVKPLDPAYEFVEKFLGTSPSNIYFYDDQPENIKKAKERGWNAFEVKESLIDVLDASLDLPQQEI